MQRFRLFFVCLLGLFIASIASIALGQAGADPTLAAEAIESTANGGWTDVLIAIFWEWLPRVVVLATTLTAKDSARFVPEHDQRRHTGRT